MKPRTIKYYFKEALKSMKRNGLMTLASISTVALSLFMLGVFLCGVINLNNMASSLENQVQLSIYLKDGLTTDQIMAVGKQIKAIPNLKHLEFVNKEQAMKEFKERLGDQQQLVNALGDVNPLPNSYVLTFDNPSDVKATAKLATTFQGVERTHYGQDIVEELFRITQVIRIGGIVLIAFLAAATLFIISNNKSNKHHDARAGHGPKLQRMNPQPVNCTEWVEGSLFPGLRLSVQVPTIGGSRGCVRCGHRQSYFPDMKMRIAD